MKDMEGNIVSNGQSLKKLYQSVYEDRLAFKDIQPEWKNLKKLQNNLFEWRIESSKQVKTPDWTVDQIKKICKKLKNGKSRDEYGLIYELFKEAFAGPDLHNSLALLFNGITELMFVPSFLEKWG